MKKIIILFIIALMGKISISIALEKKRVGVTQFAYKGVKKDIALTITDLLRNELVKSGKFEVLNRKNMKSLLQELEFQQAGITESSQAIKMGKVLNMQYMIFGSVAKLDKKILITAEMVNIKTSKIEKSAKVKFIDFDYMDNMVKNLVNQLLQGGKSFSQKEIVNKDPKLIRKYLEKKYCVTKGKYRIKKVLGYLSVYDDIIEKYYGFLLCKTTKMPQRSNEINLFSNLLVNIVFRKKKMDKAAQQAFQNGKPYKVYNLLIKPSSREVRHIETRIYQKNGKPTALEVFVKIRNKDWTAKEPKKLIYHFE